MTDFLKPTLFLSILILLSQMLSAQITAINAKITDTGGRPMLGNFVLVDSAGNVVRKEGFTGGAIQVKGISLYNFQLRLSSVLFADTTISLRYNGVANLAVNITVPALSSRALKQVEIRSALPPVRFGNNGDLVVNVAGTILATSSSVTEILSRTPGINISEGTISLQGKGEAIIYLNGSIVPAERLSSIPTSQIMKIEVIANPSAKYDAAGRAVIHITTKTAGTQGISGNIAQHVTHSDFAGTNANTFLDLGYTQQSLAISGNLGVLKGSGRELLYTTRTRPDPEEYLSSVLTTDWKRDFNTYTNYGIGARYTLSPKSVVSIAYSGNRDKLGGTVDSRNVIITNSSNNKYTSTITRDELRNTNIYTLNFSSTLDTSGSNFSAIGQHSRYGNTSGDFIEENIGISPGPPRYLQNNADHQLQIQSLQADLTQVLTLRSKLEAGLRFSTVSNSSETDFFTAGLKEGPFQLDQQLSSNFRYKEQIAAAYTSFSTKISTFSLALGLRIERTSYELNTNKANDTTKQYTNVFPNLQLEYPTGKRSSFRASYTSRIIRPRFQALNPFVIYQDPFTTIEGNPKLVPERSHAFEIAAKLDKTELKLAYIYTSDQLTAAALRGNGEENYVLKSINITADRSWLFSLTRPFTIGNWWQSVNTSNLVYSRSVDDRYGFATGKTRPQIYLYSSNTFSLNYGIKIQLLAWYLGERYYTLRHDDKRSLVTLSIEKSLLANRLKIGLTANDIFNNSNSEGDYNVGRTEIYYNRSYGNNYYKITASYRFGGNEKSAYQNRLVAQPENSRAN